MNEDVINVMFIGTMVEYHLYEDTKFCTNSFLVVHCTYKLKSNFINKKNMKLSLKLKVEVGKNIHIG